MELQLQKQENFLISGIFALPPGEEATIRQMGKSTIEEIQNIGEVTFQKCHAQSWSKIYFEVNLAEKTKEKVSWLMQKLEICDHPYFCSSRRQTEEAQKYLHDLILRVEEPTVETTFMATEKEEGRTSRKVSIIGNPI